MTLRVSLIIDGSADNAKKAIAQVRDAVKQAKDEAKQPSNNPFTPIEDGGQRAAGAGTSLRTVFKTLAREAALMGGPLAGVIGQTGTLTVGMGRLGVGVVGVTIAVAAAVATVYKAVTAFSELEQHQVRVASLLAVTKSASGQTVQGLDTMARQLASTGTQTLDDVQQAQLALLRYKAVGTDAFGAVLKTARDVAATGIAPLKDATVALAQALSDPANASDHLKEISASLSVRQQQLAKDLVATGNAAAAQKLILDSVSKQFSGADARAADTLGGAFGRLTTSSGSFFADLGRDISEALRLKDVLNGAADAAERLRKARENSPDVKALASPLWPFKVGSAIGTYIGQSITGTTPAPPPAPTPRAGRAFSGGFGSAFDEMQGDIARQQASTAENKRKAETINEVVNALEVEARTAGMSATAQKIYNEQTKAGVRDNEQYAAAAGKVAGAVNEIAARGFMRQVTEQFIAQNSALRAQAATAGMALAPAEAYRKEQELLARAEAEGITLSDARRAKLHEEALAYGGLADAAARMKLQSDITFERKTLFMSEEDVAIATKLRDLYGNNIPAAMASTEAAQLRINSAAKAFKDSGAEVTSSFFRDLRTELSSGAKGFEALRTAGLNSLGTIADKLSDMASKKLWEAALGGTSGSGGLFNLIGIFGKSGATVADPTFGGFSLPGVSAAAATFDEGGYTGKIGKKKIAGVVHGEEFVMDADTTARHLPLLQAIYEGKLDGYESGGYVGMPPSLRSALGSGGAPIVHVHPAAKGETFDAQEGPDGSLMLVGRMIDEKLDVFSRKHLPTRVHDIVKRPWDR